MDEKRLEFPCTNKCLVYASCQKLCWPYRDYVEEAYRERKYRCFKIIPPPPLQIKQLSELMNRVADGKISFTYFPSNDLLIISDVKLEGIIKMIKDVRKKPNIFNISTFPGRSGSVKELLNGTKNIN